MSKKQSKLEIIKNSLEKRAEKDITITNVEEKENFSEVWKAWNHLIEYWLAPKEGKFLAKELQEVILGLVPGLKNEIYSSNINLEQNLRNAEFFLHTNQIVYSEKIGEEKTVTNKEITITDKELMNKYGFTNGKKLIKHSVTSPLIRKISIRLFPNKELATEAYLERDGPAYNIKTKRFSKKYLIHLDDIKKYCPDIKKRLKRLNKNN